MDTEFIEKINFFGPFIIGLIFYTYAALNISA